MAHTAPAVFSVSVSSINITSTINKYLIKLEVRNSPDKLQSEARIYLDDTGGQLQFPPLDAPVQIGLGWTDTGPIAVFDGHVEESFSEGHRTSGRLMCIVCKGTSSVDQSKTSLDQHIDDATFEDAAKKFAPPNMNLQIDPTLAQVKRPYWAATGMNWLQWMQFQSKEIGGAFSASGNQAAVTKIGSNSSVSGKALTPVDATVGDNVISWHISPVYVTSQFKNFQTKWFDAAKAIWNTVDQNAQDTGAFGGATAVASLASKFKVADQDQAQQKSNANTEIANNYDKAIGTLVIDGEPTCVCWTIINLKGFRDGIDGPWTIYNVTHKLTRDEGYITEMELHPAGDALQQQEATAQPNTPSSGVSLTTPSQGPVTSRTTTQTPSSGTLGVNPPQGTTPGSGGSPTSGS